MAKKYNCLECYTTFERYDGTHCPDCAQCGARRGHMECPYPSDL